MRICVDAVDKYLAGTGRESGTVVFVGGTDSYPEALALYLAKQCAFRRGERPYIGYITVHDDVDHIHGISRLLSFDLESLAGAGRALVRRAESIHEILETINNIPDDSIIILDSTAGSPHGINSELLEDMFNRIRHGRVRTLMMLLVNSSTWTGPPLSLLAELSDVYVELRVAGPGRGVDRFMEFKYARGTLLPYVRVYYTVGPDGIQLSLREEV